VSASCARLATCWRKVKDVALRLMRRSSADRRLPADAHAAQLVVRQLHDARAPHVCRIAWMSAPHPVARMTFSTALPTGIKMFRPERWQCLGKAMHARPGKGQEG